MISEFENVEMFNVCKYVLCYEQAGVLKDFIPTSPWLINTSVVAGDQNDAKPQFWHLYWSDLELPETETWKMLVLLTRRLAQLHQLSLHEEMDTKTLRGGKNVTCNEFHMIPLLFFVFLF